MDSKKEVLQRVKNIKKLLSKHYKDEEILSNMDVIEEYINEKSFGLLIEDYEEKNPGDIFFMEKEQLIKDKNKHFNYLMEADNLDSLNYLKKNYNEKVDLIYIDPPYNTKTNSFVYNDSYNDKKNSFKHSKWLSLMKKRLIVARGLLSDDGLIFISIDDNEQAYLKVLCDEIFGEENFVSNIIWENTGQQQNKGKNFAQVTEYIVTYAKSKKNKSLIKKDSIQDRKGLKAYKKEDKRGKFRLNPIQDKSMGKYEYELIHPISKKKVYSKHWRIPKQKYLKLLDDDMIYWTVNLPNVKKHLSTNTGVLPSNVIKGIFTETSSNEIRDIFGYKAFEFTKPIELMKKIISFKEGKDILILDFFAGSGTTGHAVMELNKEDGGTRQFILCTNNENKICEDITFPRLKIAITGKRLNGTKYSDGLVENLKYLRIKK